MSFAVASISKPAVATLRTANKSIGNRLFHSPYAVLGKSPLMKTHENTISSLYEKQYDHPLEPVESHTGYRTYVVSEPDESYKHYKVPAGAYPTSSPYINFAATAAPDVRGVQYSSTGGEQLAHTYTTQAAPQHNGGVGESSAVRHGSAPGEMGTRGGGYGGMRLMDKAGMTTGNGQLGERNPPPDGGIAEKFSKAADNAWKLRK